MDKREMENWKLIKENLEAAGKTDCWFYKRACTILSTGVDPMPIKMRHD